MLKRLVYATLAASCILSSTAAGTEIPSCIPPFMTLTTSASAQPLECRYSAPEDLTQLKHGKTLWGTPSELEAIETDFSSLRSQPSSNVPILIHLAINSRVTEPAARWKYIDRVVRTTFNHNFTLSLDDLEGWEEDPTALEIWKSAEKGEVDALPDSCEDDGVSEWAEWGNGEGAGL